MFLVVESVRRECIANLDELSFCCSQQFCNGGYLVGFSACGEMSPNRQRFQRTCNGWHAHEPFKQLTDLLATAKGNLLVFPSYYRREWQEQVKFPAVPVNYRFTGFLDEIYATLVVRLHHSDAFQQDELWRYAADRKTNAGKQLGIKLTRRAPGVGDLEVYFDRVVAMEGKIISRKYVHERFTYEE